MTRLTKETKKTLCENLLRVSPLYQKAKDTLINRVKLVERIRLACLSQEGTSDEEISAVVEKVNKIKAIKNFAEPDIRMATTLSSTLEIGINGERRDLSTRGVDRLWSNTRYSHRITDTEYFGKEIIPSDIPSGFVPINRVLLKNADNFYDELLSSDSQIASLLDELEEFRLKVMGALQPINTVKQLEKHWPDAVPHLPIIVRPTKTEIALSPDALNAICGLPTESEAT